MRRYNPKEIEPKWQEVWDKTQVYKADLNSYKTKYIAMSMFNYPSGDGIHIGHAMNYTISDVMARFRRQQGYESYHPVGWDSFGLPAENYAIKTGISPQQSMAKIIPNYHMQYKAMGWSNDWSKEIATHEPEYYKWTQWIFIQMHKRRLVYQDSRLQWWCPIDNTVLANEQVTADGKCWRHDGPNDPPAEKKEVKQWFFKITDYSDELLSGLNDLDWPESIKGMQRNWIGKSEGMLFTCPVKDMDLELQTFSAHFESFRADTFVVIAPEHPLLKKLVKGLPEEKKVLETASEILRKRDLPDHHEDEYIEGVFTGRYVIDPVGNGELPIWVASFAVADYGTGIIKCSAHDERDFKFAKKYGIKLKPVLFPPDDKEAEKVRRLEYCYTDMQNGILTEPKEFAGKVSGKERQNIIKYLEEHRLATKQTTYRLRDWSVSRQRYWGAPIPVIHCPKCGPRLVPEKDLPVVLPEIKDFEPTGDGRSALARATNWLKVACPKCGGEAERETDTMDTYVDSAWYMIRYFDPFNSKKIVDSDIVDKWMPVDFYNGADHATAHLIYARFITRFFKKIGLVEEPEPFKKFLFNGKVVNSDGSFFSKSKGVIVDPISIIDQGYGADALRTYLMFAAPLDTWTRWDPQGVPGTYRFLSRLWNLAQEFMESKKGGTGPAGPLLVHRTIKKVTTDIESLKYNTAIASMMATINDLYKIKDKEGVAQTDSWRFAIESMVQLVAPFAPFMAEELWSQMGYEESVHLSQWPKWDELMIKDEMITLAVQINGKVRAEVEVEADISEAEAIEAAKTNPKIAALIKDNKIKKAIYVTKRLVSLVI